MISWGWLFVAFCVGGCVGMYVTGLLTMAKQADDDRERALADMKAKKEAEGE